MNRKIILEIPEKTKALTISLVAETNRGDLTLTTKGVDTAQILEGQPIVIDTDGSVEEV